MAADDERHATGARRGHRARRHRRHRDRQEASQGLGEEGQLQPIGFTEDRLPIAGDEGDPTVIRPHCRTQSTGEWEWYTPAEYIEAARVCMGGIDLDPASSLSAQESVRASRFLAKEDNGLSHEWHGRVFLNPPYAQPGIALFVNKLLTENAAGRVTRAILLTHNYTDTTWFQAAGKRSAALCLTRGRIKFVSPTGAVAAPTQGQAFFYFGDEFERFCEVFGGFGIIVSIIRGPAIASGSSLLGVEPSAPDRAGASYVRQVQQMVVVADVVAPVG